MTTLSKWRNSSSENKTHQLDLSTFKSKTLDKEESFGERLQRRKYLLQKSKYFQNARPIVFK